MTAASNVSELPRTSILEGQKALIVGVANDRSCGSRPRSGSATPFAVPAGWSAEPFAVLLADDARTAGTVVSLQSRNSSGVAQTQLRWVSR
jgi:hypothetical protein